MSLAVHCVRSRVDCGHPPTNALLSFSKTTVAINKKTVLLVYAAYYRPDWETKIHTCAYMHNLEIVRLC